PPGVAFARFILFFFIDTAPTEISPLSLHDALPILRHVFGGVRLHVLRGDAQALHILAVDRRVSVGDGADRRAGFLCRRIDLVVEDRKSTRLNSSHVKISYAVFCLKKKKKPDTTKSI